MSCSGKGYGTKPQSNLYLSSQFGSSSNPSIKTINNKNVLNCINKVGYPSFTPELYALSKISSNAKTYSLVYITGSNFLPNGTTFVKFGSFGFLPITYYSSFNMSFVVPLNAVVGNYNVQVVNLYNGNFSPSVNQSYPGNLNFSKSITYTIS
jgi:hypothetical protein